MKKCLYETGGYNKAIVWKLLECKETTKLKTETFLFLKETFIWSKIYRVVNHSVNMVMVEIEVGNFPEKEQLFRKFRATYGQGYLHLHQ